MHHNLSNVFERRPRAKRHFRTWYKRYSTFTRTPPLQRLCCSRLMSTYIAPFQNLTHTAQPYADAAGNKLSRVQITRRYSGDAAGESSSDLHLCETPNGMMAYAGTDHFVGTLKGRAGSFVYQ